MPRRASGQVIERRWRASLTFALRFPAYGERRYVTLGSAAGGWDRGRAEEELENVLADVRRGIWIPPERRGIDRDAEVSDALRCEPSFHRFASGWLAGRRGEVAAATHDYYAWALSHHLLPYSPSGGCRRSTSRPSTHTGASRSPRPSSARRRSPGGPLAMGTGRRGRCRRRRSTRRSTCSPRY
jgi:hypothetical protein